MAKAAKNNKTTINGSSDIDYEAQLWQMADALRGSMDAAEYKHVVFGLTFLKYISDAFEERHVTLLAEKAKGADSVKTAITTAHRASSGCRPGRAGRFSQRALARPCPPLRRRRDGRHRTRVPSNTNARWE